MHKFNLKGKAAERMKGIVPDTKTAAENAAKPETAQPNAECENIRFAWRTDTGRVRKSNQDAVILGNSLFGVADGMGGHNGGEIASAGLRDGLIRETKDAEPGEDVLRAAIEKVNRELWEQQEKDAALTGMGTTLTVLWPGKDRMFIAQVGDSRAYLIRGGEMKQVTSDHSMVADMVRRGVLTEEQAACHPMRNYITRAVGTDDTIETDLFVVPREHGDRWLICSDGLHGQMERPVMEQLAREENLEKAADALLQLALENGGKDNISLVLMEDDGEYTHPEETPAPGSDAAPEEKEAAEQ